MNSIIIERKVREVHISKPGFTLVLDGWDDDGTRRTVKKIVGEWLDGKDWTIPYDKDAVRPNKQEKPNGNSNQDKGSQVH